MRGYEGRRAAEGRPPPLVVPLQARPFAEYIPMHNRPFAERIPMHSPYLCQAHPCAGLTPLPGISCAEYTRQLGEEWACAVNRFVEVARP